MEIIFIIICLALILAFIVLIRNNQTAQQRFEQERKLWLQEKEQLQLEIIKYQTKIESYEQRMQQNQQQLEQQATQLKEQLRLMAQSFIQQGSTQISQQNEQQLQQLLKPFQESILQFKREIQEHKEKGIEQHSSLRELIGHLHQQHEQMHSTAQNLVDAFRGEQKLQGDWGEIALQRILENSGLAKDIDYTVQENFKDENNNNVRPDVVVYLPDNKHIIIDSKVSLVAFERYVNASSEEEKQLALKAHITSIRTHIKQLGAKSYESLKGIHSPEFVLLFMPLESSFALAIKEEPTLYEAALHQKIVIVTPSTLLATLKTVSSIWKYEKQTKNAIAIAEQASKLYDKFVGFLTDMDKIGVRLEDANKSFREAMNKLKDGNGNLIRSAEKLKELGVKSKKDIDPRYLD